MYEKFYGLREKPFQIVPNPRFLYLSPKHQHALTYLEYGIREGMGFILLTGEIGTGKTTLIRHVLNEIEQEIEVAVVFNTNVSAGQLLALILREFELPADSVDKAEQLEVLYQFLIKQYARQRRVLLIVDEAQNLDDAVLEEVRMLSNLQADDNLLLHIMLVGQPELKTRLQRPGLAQLAQRIGVSYHLMPLDRQETGAYISSRLEKAGGDPHLFCAEAVGEIFNASGGTPRSINLLCDSALVYGFADELRTIDRNTVKQVVEDRGKTGVCAELSEADGECPASSAMPVLPAAEHGGDDIGGRLADLEDAVRELRYQALRRREECERRFAAGQEDLVARLTEELALVREKNETLLQENGRLQEKLASLSRQAGGNYAEAAREKGLPAAAAGRNKKKLSWFSFLF